MSKPTATTTNGNTYRLSYLGPLTTPFTAPGPCLTEYWPSDSLLRLGVESRTDCFPPGFLYERSLGGYYSPGVCPASYTEAEPLQQWGLGPGDTGFYCCPSGYTHAIGSCTLSLSDAITTQIGSMTSPYAFTKIWANAVVVVRQSGSTSLLILSTPSSPGAAPTGVVPGSEQTAPATGTGSPAPTGPSNTTTIAIATAVPVVLIALSILAFIVYRRRTRSHPDPAGTGTSSAIPELESDQHKVSQTGPQGWPVAVELPTRQALPSELQATTAVGSRAAHAGDGRAAGPPSRDVGIL